MIIGYLRNKEIKQCFEDEEEAIEIVDKMMEVNEVTKIYSHISLNKWSWEMFVEP